MNRLLRIALRVVAAFLVIISFAEQGRGAEESAELRKLVIGAKRIVFLGDSITAGGGYIAAFDGWVHAQRKDDPPLVINLGLPSETVSGLSEDGHAGGAFPRPDLAERLARVLATARPDLVFACYGMNCGIYLPLDESRFEKYRTGASRLKEEVEKTGAKIIFITPPHYDSLPHPQQAYYNGVLDRYSQWLLDRRKSGWHVIDLHGPMTRYLEDRRKREPKFAFAGDGVHPNEAGQWFIAQQLIGALGDEKSAAAENPRAMLESLGYKGEAWPLVQQRMSILRDSYVAAAGHKRPGVAKGLPIADAEKQAAELAAKVSALRK